MVNPLQRPPSLLALRSYLAGRVTKVLRAEFERVLSERDLGSSDYGILVALGDFGVLSQQQLADRLDADKSHVVRLVDQLEARGLLTRTPDPTDRRRHRIDLTPAARKLLRQLRPSVERADDAALQALSSAERRTLSALLERVLDSHDQAHTGRRDQASAKP
jgi:DNA-binding MarR family transcriptional regulator